MLSSFKMVRMLSRQVTFRTFCTASVARVPNTVESINVNISINKNLKNVVEGSQTNMNTGAKNETEKINTSTHKTVVASPKKRLIDESDDDEATELKELKSKAQSKMEDQVFHKKEKGYWVHVEHFINLVKKGTIDMKNDSAYLKSIFSGNLLYNERYTAFELRERRRISKDIVKFIPFFAMLLIPGGEILIPVYVAILPNATPNQLLSESEKGMKLGEKNDLQASGYKVMKNGLPNFINVIGLDSLHYRRAVDKFEKSEGSNKEMYFYTAQCFVSTLDNFMRDGDHSKENLENILLDNLTTKQLENICKFIYLEYIPGNNMINF